MTCVVESYIRPPSQLVGSPDVFSCLRKLTNLICAQKPKSAKYIKKRIRHITKCKLLNLTEPSRPRRMLSDLEYQLQFHRGLRNLLMYEHTLCLCV